MNDLVQCIPCYNAVDWIEECLRGVCAQDTAGCPRRVAVVDDGSTDGTWEKLRQLQSALSFDLLRSDTPRSGPYRLINRVLREMPARWCQVVGADDVLLPGAVVRLLGLMERTGAWIAGGQACYMEADGSPAAETTWFPHDVNTFMEMTRTSAVLHSGMMIDRRAVEKIGFFDESFICAMDTEYVFRAAQAGVVMRNTPSEIIRVRLHRAGGSLTAGAQAGRKSAYWQAAQAMIAQKYPRHCVYAARFVEFFRKEMELQSANPVLAGCYRNYLERYIETHISDPAEKKVLARVIRRPALTMLEALVKTRWHNAALRGYGRVFLYGAGKHADWLLPLVAGAPGPKIVALLDDAPRPDAGRGHPLVKTGEADWSQADAVVLNTDVFQARMRKKLQQIAPKDFPVVDLYENLPPGPYAEFSTFWMWL